MRALRVHAFGGLDRLVLDEAALPEPGRGELRIEVEAAGLNFADILMIAGRYQVRPPLPFSPGFEVAGTVDACGPGTVGFAVGDRVTANPWFGGFAEYVVVPESGAFLRPDHVSSTVGAAATAAFGTAYHALIDRGALVAGETVVVTGATGGVGSASIQVAKATGATVIGAVGSEAKAGHARRLGCDAVVTYDEGPPIRDQVVDAAGGKGGIDVLLDLVGGSVFEELARELRPRGRALVVGFAGGDIPTIPLNILLLKEVAAVGVFWGAFREREHEAGQAQLDKVWSWLERGSLQMPPIETHPLESAADVLGRLAAREIVGKAVLTMVRRGA